MSDDILLQFIGNTGPATAVCIVLLCRVSPSIDKLTDVINHLSANVDKRLDRLEQQTQELNARIDRLVKESRDVRR